MSNLSNSSATELNSSSTVGQELGLPSNIIIGVTFFAVAIFVASLIGNVVVIHIVSSVNHMRSSTNMLIANMAVADLLMAIDLPYIVKWLFVGDRWFGTFAGSALCKFFHSAQTASVACSVLSLVAISFDRSLAILCPMREIFTHKVVTLAMALTWLGALGFAVPLMIATVVIDGKGVDYSRCNEDWSHVSHGGYVIALFTLTYAVPLLLIAFAYLLTGLRLWSRKIPGHKNLVSHAHQKATGRRATFMLITVVVVFALFWLPFQAREVIRWYNSSLGEQIPVVLMVVFPFIGFSNSAINPILYVIFSENFRREFTRILWHRESTRDRYRNSVIRRTSSTRLSHLSREHRANVMTLHQLRKASNTGRPSIPKENGDRILDTLIV